MQAERIAEATATLAERTGAGSGIVPRSGMAEVVPGHVEATGTL